MLQSRCSRLVLGWRLTCVTWLLLLEVVKHASEVGPATRHAYDLGLDEWALSASAWVNVASGRVSGLR
jgi:hypothetical protein